MIDPLEILMHFLGYEKDSGYVAGKDFTNLPNHKHALRVARNTMSVSAAFGLWTGGNGALAASGHSRFTPLVFLATVDDITQAKKIHRSVWSQGLAPYLIIMSPDNVWLCQGFGYSASDWKTKVKEFKISEFQTTQSSEGLIAAFKPVMATTLRSSVAWRDEARIADEFVDERLLQSLAELSIMFSRENSGARAISASAVNALIARLLYFYFLVDRQFITKERLRAWGLERIGIDNENEWSLKETTELFSRLDEVFNGSIFPLPERHLGSFDATHINQLRRVLREGETSSGQLSFFDYDFATIRTETLSAIYEMFLHNESEDAGKQFGAYYTPPYVADYTLDRLEDQRPFTRNTRVMDPAAGSGVFLVGAYRRIVEACLPSGTTQLPLKDLHGLMMDNIFAVELNETACHVAAFSLYLTMLDYIDPAEADDYTNWPMVEGESKLFPPMLASNSLDLANIQAVDFFSEQTQGITCDIIVGNPPWVPLGELKSTHANEYLKKTAAPIGGNQAAELFAWKAYSEHLAADGLIGLLLPQKSLVNKRSEIFSKFLRLETEIVGIADLAHLRYRLFRRSGAKTVGSVSKAASKSARQATAVVILQKRIPKKNHQIWTFRPLLTMQPGSRRNRLWIVLHDWSQVHWHTQSETDERAWRRLFTCAQVDRHILRKMDKYVTAGHFISLGSLKDTVGLCFTIKDNEKLDPQFVLSADPKKPTYWKKQLGLDVNLIPEDQNAVPLPIEQVEQSPEGSRPFLQGHTVLMPRTCETAIYVEKPIATKSFVVGSFRQPLGKAVSPKQKIFLKAVAAYMATDIFRYLCLVNGRRMTIDRLSIELGAVTQLPWPFGDLNDERLLHLVNADLNKREQLVADALKLTKIYTDTIREFTTLRRRFKDGGTPPEVLCPVASDELEDYKCAVLEQVDRGKSRYAINSTELENGLVAIIIQYCGNQSVKASPESSIAYLKLATRDYAKQGASGMTQSRYMWHSRKAMTTILIKPKERLHWTFDRAFSDSDLVVAAAMSGFTSTEAA